MDEKESGMALNTSKVTRFEIIDHTPCPECEGSGRDSYSIEKECEACFGLGCPGRAVIMRDDNKQVDVSLQDDGRTLKVFIHERISE